MNGNLVPVQIAALFTVNIVKFNYLASTISAQTTTIAEQPKQIQKLEKVFIKIN